MSKICEVSECIAKRVLAEYSWIYNTMISCGVLPCRWSALRSKKTKRCQDCFLLEEKALKNILHCVLSQKLEPETTEVMQQVVFCEKNPKKIQGIQTRDSKYWVINSEQTYDQYNACLHPLPSKVPSNILIAPFWEEALQFIVATIAFEKQHDRSDCLDKVCCLFCRTPYNLKKLFSGSVQTCVQNFCAKTNQKDFFCEDEDDFGKDVKEIFQYLSDYINKTQRGDSIGYERQLNTYLQRLHKDQSDGFHPLALVS